MAEPPYEAIHANRLVAVERVAHINPRSSIESRGPWLLVDTAEPGFAAANSATPVGPCTPGDVDDAIEWFRARRSPITFIARSNADDALRAELARRGFETTFEERSSVLEAPAPPKYEGPLLIRRPVSGEDIEAYGGDRIGVAVARTAAALGFTLLLGELDGEPIATAMAVVTGEVVGVYNVGVREAYRRRGFGSAMTWAAVAAGVDQGARLAWIGATPMAFSVYGRMGFEERLTYLHLEPPGRTPFD
jgi:ribosomal protein S18 acetylase RimI-like enzyme